MLTVAETFRIWASLCFEVSEWRRRQSICNRWRSLSREKLLRIQGEFLWPELHNWLHRLIPKMPKHPELRQTVHT